MTLLHLSDLHYHKPWFEWISTEHEKYDVICITGDFLDPSHAEPISLQIEWVKTWMSRIKKPILICSGNHDINDDLDENWIENIPNVCSDYGVTTIGNTKFGCVPYIAPEFLDFTQCDVLLTHIPPAKTKTSIHYKTDADWGDRELARLLKNNLLRPKMILCGHMHEPIAVADEIHKTRIFNPGVSMDNKIPAYNVIKY